MILLKEQLIIDYDDLCIMEDGDYSDTTLVTFCNIKDMNIKVTEFQADYVISRLRV